MRADGKEGRSSGREAGSEPPAWVEGRRGEVGAERRSGEGPRTGRARVGGDVPAAGNAGAFQNVEKQEVAASPPPFEPGPPAPPHLRRSSLVGPSPYLSPGNCKMSVAMSSFPEIEASGLITDIPQMVAQESYRGLTGKPPRDPTLESLLSFLLFEVMKTADPHWSSLHILSCLCVGSSLAGGTLRFQ